MAQHRPSRLGRAALVAAATVTVGIAAVPVAQASGSSGTDGHSYRHGLVPTIEWFRSLDLRKYRAPTPNY